MLRIKGEPKGKLEEPMPELPPDMPEEPLLEEPPMAEEPEVGKIGPDKVDPFIAGYRPPELGPFSCSSCFHFDGQGGCNIVSGPIDPNGLCNLHTTPDEPVAPMEPEVPEGAPPMEPPVEPELPPV